MVAVLEIERKQPVGSAYHQDPAVAQQVELGRNEMEAKVAEVGHEAGIAVGGADMLDDAAGEYEVELLDMRQLPRNLMGINREDVRPHILRGVVVTAAWLQSVGIV